MNVKMRKIVKKRFLKKKENSDTMIFDVVDVKNSNVMTFMKSHINDTTTISSNFTKFFFEFENFLKKESATQMQKKEQKKKKFEKERERKLRENKKEKER